MFCFVAAVMFTGSGVASATTLVDTSFGLGAPWQGSQNFTNTGPLSQELDADVEFAVFAAGDFQEFLDENGIVYNDPAPAEFIYAYQIAQITKTTAGISSLSVGLNGNEALGQSGVTFIPMATDYGTYSPQPTADSDIVGGGPGESTSSTWNGLPGFAPNGASGILFYSSPDGPELGFSTLAAGTAIATRDVLPNPVPEPASSTMLATLLVLGAMTRRVRIQKPHQVFLGCRLNQ
jgi:hypothetical protein